MFMMKLTYPNWLFCTHVIYLSILYKCRQEVWMSNSNQFTVFCFINFLFLLYCPFMWSSVSAVVWQRSLDLMLPSVDVVLHLPSWIFFVLFLLKSICLFFCNEHVTHHFHALSAVHEKTLIFWSSSVILPKSLLSAAESLHSTAIQ